jgi:hypothetical protein
MLETEIQGNAHLEPLYRIVLQNSSTVVARSEDPTLEALASFVKTNDPSHIVSKNIQWILEQIALELVGKNSSAELFMRYCNVPSLAADQIFSSILSIYPDAKIKDQWGRDFTIPWIAQECVQRLPSRKTPLMESVIQFTSSRPPISQEDGARKKRAVVETKQGTNADEKEKEPKTAKKEINL